MNHLLSFSSLLLSIFFVTNDGTLATSTAMCECEQCGTIPYPTSTGYVTPDPILFSPQVWSFNSEPNLHPMKIKVNVCEPRTSPGFIFLAPYSFSSDATYGQAGALMVDNSGDPVWFRPQRLTNLMNTDFRVQKLFGKPVLTFWQGTLATPPAYTNAPGGSSEPGSCYYILDQSYEVIKTVKASIGFTPDIHEFLLTPNNTALFLSTKTVPMNLTPYGGPADGYVQDFAIQEIDLKTNKLVFFWDALKHIPLTDSYEPASSATSTGNVWDVYHLNSIGLSDDKRDIIVSGRNLWTIFKIDRRNGDIIWRLGGKQSSFSIDSDASFSWQHDARILSHNTISMFDDNCCESSTIPPGTPPARGLELKLNFCTMTASVKRTYYHDPNLQVGSQGNVQSLPNGNKFVGFGESSYFSEFRNAGNTVDDTSLNLIFDAQMPGNNYTYRAYRNEWIGKPCYPPSIAVKTHHHETTVYASWNGSTETASWEVYAGSSARHLKKLTRAKRVGFETAINTRNPGPYFKVVALDARGHKLKESSVVTSEAR